MTVRAIAWIAALLWAASSPLALAQTLRVGSKNFTEQFVVAELYAAALEAAGFKVERKINLGATLVAHEAMRTGAIDLYPEYTGTGLNAVMKAQGVTDARPDKVYAMVKALLREGVQAHLAETVRHQQRLRDHRAARDGADDEPEDAVRSRQGRVDAEDRRRTGIRRPSRRPAAA